MRGLWGDGRIIAIGGGPYNGNLGLLDTAAKAGDEGFGKIDPAHLFLGGGYIVGDSVVADGVVIAVVDGVVGSGDPVSGLADSARVDEERSLPKLDGHADGKLEETASQVIGVNAAYKGEVGVSDEAVACMQMLEAGQGRGLCDEIFPNGVSGSAVDDGEVLFHDCQGEAVQVIGVVCGEVRLSPLSRCFGVGVEVPGVDLADGGPVVVAGYGDVIVLSQEVDNLTGVGPVADDVSERP